MKHATKILSLVILLAGANAYAGALSLSWVDNSNNETGFEIERCEGSGCTGFGLIATIGAGMTTYADQNLPDGFTYCYRVRAVNATGPSGYTNVACNTTQPAVPAAPSNLVVNVLTTSGAATRAAKPPAQPPPLRR